MSKLFEAMAKGQAAVPVPAWEKIIAEQSNQPEAAFVATETLAVPLTRSTSASPIPTDKRQTATAIHELPLKVTAASLLPFGEGNWTASEQYRMVRTRILQRNVPPRLILITSAGVSDGKSVTAANLAAAFALKSDATVLLIDGDLRRGSIHTQLGLPNAPGLGELLHGQCSINEAVIRTQQLPNLYVMTCGNSERHASELLDSAAWRSTCETLRNQFACVILDSPPVAAVADYDLLQEVCDGVVMVVRPDHSNRKLFFDALKSVPKEKLLGVVLNCTQAWFMSQSHDYRSSY